MIDVDCSEGRRHLIPSPSGEDTTISFLGALLAVCSPSSPLFEEECHISLFALMLK